MMFNISNIIIQFNIIKQLDVKFEDILSCFEMRNCYLNLIKAWKVINRGKPTRVRGLTV